jgi:hypothetical protein
MDAHRLTVEPSGGKEGLVPVCLHCSAPPLLVVSFGMTTIPRCIRAIASAGLLVCGPILSFFLRVFFLS